MRVELGKLRDGRMMMMCDAPFPHVVQRVEYYREQKLFLLVYDHPDQQDDLLHYELNDVSAKLADANSSILIVSRLAGDRRINGYGVELVKV
jgi:hypothetical protein